MGIGRTVGRHHDGQHAAAAAPEGALVEAVRRQRLRPAHQHSQPHAVPPSRPELDPDAIAKNLVGIFYIMLRHN